MDEDPKIASLATRMHNMAIASNVTIGQAVSAHFNCLANLALEQADGSEKAAAENLRKAMESLILTVYKPPFRRKLELIGGRIVNLITPANDR